MTAVDTEGMDIKSWLKSKNLENIIPKFTTAGLTLEDIMQCSEDDIRELCKENKWSAVIRIKLISAIKSTPGSAASQSQPQIIFLGDKEKEIMDKLYKKTEKISNDINSLQKAINGLEKSAVECNKEIHSKCDILLSIIEKKRKFLLNTINELKNKRRSELDTELNKLQEMNQCTMKSQTTCKTVAVKADISSSLRLEKMNTIIEKQNEMEQKINFDVHKINPSNVKLIVVYNQKLFDSNFAAALNVTFSDEELELKYQNEDEKIEVLKFSTTYKSSDNIKLSEDNKCVTKGSSSHDYILADIDPVKKGIHCYRIQSKNPGHWIMWGISKKLKFSSSSYGEVTAGFTSNNKYYGGLQHNTPNYKPFSAKENEVDMLLNIDQGKLDLCVVGHNTDQNCVKFWNLPNNPDGWVPHFNIYHQNSQMRIAKIPSSLFGKPDKNIFV